MENNFRIKGKGRSRIVLKIALILFVEVIVLMSALEFLSLSSVRKTTTAQLTETYASLVDAQSANVLNRNSKFYQQLRFYTHNDYIYNKGKPVPTEDIVQWLVDHKNVRSYDFVDVYYCDVDEGIARSDTGKEMDLRGTDMLTRIVDEQLNQYISDPVGTNAEDSVYYICKTISKNKKVVGFFMVSISHDTLVRAVSAMKVGATGFATLITKDGTVMAFPPDDSYVLTVNAFDAEKSMGIQGLTPIIQDMADGGKSSGWVTYQGKKYLMVYAPVSNTYWSISLVIPEDEIYTPVEHLKSSMIVYVIIISLILVLTVVIGVLITMKPLKKLDKNIKQIASGDADLTHQIPITGNDEIASVTESFNVFVDMLRNIMKQVKDSKVNLQNAGIAMKGGIDENSASVDSIMDSLRKVNEDIEKQRESVHSTAGAVNEIAANIDSLENMIATQAAGINQASAAVEQMIGNIASVNGSVEKMADSFEALEDKAKNGNLKQSEMSEKIQSIAIQSEMLQDANQIISAIAEQTNLLAMNAAIEAAHAGEAGKGFSVVADEIRKLAETSSEQSKTIGDQLNNITEAIEAVVSSSAETQATFDSVASSIRATDEIVHQIKSAMTEQNEGSHQIVNALKEMSNSSVEVRSASKEMALGNKAILDSVNHLEGMTQEIQTSMEDVRGNARKIHETGFNLTDISENMNGAITAIGNQIDNFQV